MNRKSTKALKERIAKIQATPVLAPVQSAPTIAKTIPLPVVAAQRPVKSNLHSSMPGFTSFN